MRYLLRRATMFVLTLWAAVTLNFIIPRLMPGSPADAALAKFAGQGPVSPAQRQAVEAMLGLPHGSMIGQYGSYLAHLARFSFGVSYTYFPQSVAGVIGQALPWTLVLVGTATVVAFVAGTLLGVLAAWRRGRTLDALATVGDHHGQRAGRELPRRPALHLARPEGAPMTPQVPGRSAHHRGPVSHSADCAPPARPSEAPARETRT